MEQLQQEIQFSMNKEFEMLCIRNAMNIDDVIQDMPDYDVEYLKRTVEAMKANKNKVEQLLQIPKIEQKSDEWYRTRENLITASDFAQALGHGKFGTQIDIIKKKVKPVDESLNSKSNPFFKWGNMFEPVASKIYSLMHNNVKIHEFGLIQHPKRPYFGASPDGITEYGVMLEIKCPYKRKIENGGDVPKQYYYQIQGQLDVCQLEECDYFECQFVAYKSRDEFENINDGQKPLPYKGVIVEIEPAKYIYSDVYCDATDVLDWLDEYIEENNEYIDIKFWVLSNYNLKRVKLDKPFVNDNLDKLEVFWQKIIDYRNNPDKYKVEIEKTIDIGETSKLRPNKLTGYAFKDVDE